MTFLECANPARYNTLCYSLRNNSLTSVDYYPKIFTDSLNLLSHYRPPVKHTIPQCGGGKQRGKNVHLTQVKDIDQQFESISGTDGNTRADVTCYNWKRPGHILLFCPNEENIQKFHVTLNQSEVLIPISWVLFDSGSTVSSIFNADIVDNIRDANVTTTVHTNGDSKDYTQTAPLHLLPLNFDSIPHPLNIFFPFQRWKVIIELPWTPLSNHHSTYTSTTIQLSSF